MAMRLRTDRWGGISILDRYVAREFLVSFLIALMVVLSLRVLMDVFISFDEFIEKDAGGRAPTAVEVLVNVGLYYGPRLLEYFRDFCGTMVLLAAAFSLTRLMRQNELTAILASGVSLKRVIAPIVFVGFLLNLVMVLDQEMVLPRFADQLTRSQDEMHKQAKVNFWLVLDRGGALLSAQDYDYEHKTMRRVHILLREEGLLSGQIMADEAVWVGPNRWKLNGGVLRTEAGEESVAFYESGLSPEYLWLRRNSNYKSLMSSGDLGKLLPHLKGGEYAEAISERNFRFTDPIINMIMLLLGLPMLVSRERRNTKSAMAAAFLGAGGCLVVTFACKLLAGDILLSNNQFLPLLIAWIPIIIFLPLSVLVLDALKT